MNIPIEFELWRDESYFDMWALRPKGVQTMDRTLHFAKREDADAALSVIASWFAEAEDNGHFTPNDFRKAYNAGLSDGVTATQAKISKAIADGTVLTCPSCGLKFEQADPALEFVGHAYISTGSKTLTLVDGHPKFTQLPHVFPIYRIVTTDKQHE
jgi:hypothetical protein